MLVLALFVVFLVLLMRVVAVVFVVDAGTIDVDSVVVTRVDAAV